MGSNIARSLFILKTVAKNPAARYMDIAEITKSTASTVGYVLKDFAGLRDMTRNDADFPIALIRQFTDSEGNELSREEVDTLVQIVDRRILKNKSIPKSPNTYDADEPDDRAGPDAAENDEEYGNFKKEEPAKAVRTATMSRTPTPDESRQQGPDLSSDSALMKWVLQRTRNATPQHITNFMDMFEMNQEQYVRQPMTLYSALVYGFGEVPGQAAFKAFMEMRPRMVYDVNPANAMFNQAAASQLSAQFPGLFPQAPNTAGSPNMMNNPQYVQMQLEEQMEDLRDRREERKMERMYRHQMMQNFQNMTMAQSPMNPGTMGGNIRETYDKEGKVIQRETIRNGHGGDSDVYKMFFENYKEANKEKNDILMKILEDRSKNSSPVEVLKTLREMKDLGGDLFGGGRGGYETPETLELKLDSNLRVLDKKFELRKLQHEWAREAEDRIAAHENMRSMMEDLKGLAGGVVEKVLPEIARGAGMAIGKRRAAQQEQMAAQNQQAYSQYAGRQQYQQPRPQQYGYVPGGYPGGTPPASYGEPAPEQPRAEQPRRSEAIAAMKNNMMEDEYFAGLADEDLDRMQKEIYAGVSRLSPVLGKIKEEKQRRHVRHQRRKQDIEGYRLREQEKMAREEELAGQRARIARPEKFEPSPQPSSSPTEFVPAAGYNEPPSQPQAAPEPAKPSEPEPQTQRTEQSPPEEQGVEEEYEAAGDDEGTEEADES